MDLNGTKSGVSFRDVAEMAVLTAGLVVAMKKFPTKLTLEHLLPAAAEFVGTTTLLFVVIFAIVVVILTLNK